MKIGHARGTDNAAVRRFKEYRFLKPGMNFGVKGRFISGPLANRLNRANDV